MESIADRFADQTTIEPMGLAAIIVLGLAMLSVPRRYTIVPMLLTACLMPVAQRIAIATMDFHVIRIMVLFGWVRVVARGELRALRLGRIDYALLFWAIAGASLYIVRERTPGAVVNQLGGMFDALGLYFLFRILLRDWSQFDRAMRYTAIVAAITALAFAREWVTGKNIFYHLGAVSEYTIIRDGRLRCQGAFSHPIIAGVFWASLLPLQVAQWWRGPQARTWSVIGGGCALFIVMTTSSSTPLLAVIIGLLGGALFLARQQLAVIRLGVLGMLIAMHVVMDKGVHHIFVRLNVIGGSTGRHRYSLIDNWMRHFGEWAVVGTSSTAHWGRMMFDVTNQYVAESVRGGLVRFGAFMMLIIFGFRSVGEMLRWVRGDRARTAYVWAMGVTLLVHCASFFSVSYYGQMIMVWYLHLAVVASMHSFEQARVQSARFARHQPIKRYAPVAVAR